MRKCVLTWPRHTGVKDFLRPPNETAKTSTHDAGSNPAGFAALC